MRAEAAVGQQRALEKRNCPRASRRNGLRGVNLRHVPDFDAFFAGFDRAALEEHAQRAFENLLLVP